MDSLTTIFFYIHAVVLLFSAVSLIFAKRVISSALFGVIAFLSVSGIYFMLNATFNAAAQIAVYVVAVTILIIFAIMLTPQKEDKNMWISFKPRLFLSLGALFVIFLCITWAIVDNYLERILDIMAGGISLGKSLDTVYMIGEKLMTDYVLSFELASVLLLTLIVGIGLVCVVQKSEENQ